MRKHLGAICGLLAAGLAGCASNADFQANVPGELATPVQAHFIPNGAEAAEPTGYVGFCIRFADQCKTSAATSIALNDATWKALNQVNLSVNNSIFPEEDEKHYGRAEYWTIPTDGAGDCEDIALTKRQVLAKAGYPISALRIAVVVTPTMERHAILTIATDEGDLVLDNLTNQVRPWNSTGYRWIERQDPSRAMQWVSVDPNAVMLAQAQGNLPTGQARQ